MKNITKLLPFLIALIFISFLSGCGGSNTKSSRALLALTLDEPITDTLAVSQNDVVSIANRPPQALGQSFRINSGVEYLGQLKVSDEDGDSLTFTIVNEPTNGTLSLNENGTFKYVSSEVGVDSFSFYVSDGVLQSQEQIVDITLSQDDIDVPSTPLNLIAIRVDQTTAKLQWQDNSDDEVLFAILDESYNLLQVVDADINETTITGLDPTVDYTFILKSRNSAGHIDSAQTTLLKVSGQDALINVGTIVGTVKDLSAGKSPLVGATVSIYVGDKFLKAVVTDIDGNFILEDISSLVAHKIVVSKDGYLDGVYYDILAIANDTVILDTILQVKVDQSGIGRVSGKITNAIDGVGVDALLLNVRRGINVKSGDIVAMTTTDGNGYYDFSELSAGNYTLEVIGEGFITGYFTVVSVGEKNSDNQNFSITPILLDGEIRVVLTWGESPKDLDSHLTGPLENSDERFHVSFRAKGSQVTSPYSFLDLDDTIKYGPETITIKKQKEGVYRYSVLDYTNARSSVSSALGNSGAKVKVYKGSNLIQTFNVPNQEGVFWAVFDIVGDEIVPINRVQYVKEYDPVD